MNVTHLVGLACFLLGVVVGAAGVILYSEISTALRWALFMRERDNDHD
jgi:hypothetical protein